MTVGRLPEEYRVKQNKNQKEFSVGIANQSYYSKVKKNVHRTTADDLLSLLTHGVTSVKTFFGKPEIDPHQEQVNRVNAIFEKIAKTNYVDNLLAQIKKIRAKAVKLDVEANMKRGMLLIIDGVLGSEKNDPETFDINLRNRLKEKIFLMPEYDTYKLLVYTNFVDLYDSDNNQ